MSRDTLQAEINEAEQELAALLEKLINVPVTKAVKDQAGVISFNLKQDLEQNIAVVRSDAKKTRASFDDASERVSDIFHVVSRLEHVAGALGHDAQTRHEQLQETLLERSGQAVQALATLDERQHALAKTQVQRTAAAINDLSASVQQLHLAQLNAIALARSEAHDAVQVLVGRLADQEAVRANANKVAATRFSVLCGLLVVTLLAAGAAVLKLYMG